MIQYENQLSKTYRKCFLMASKLSNAPAEVPLPNCDPSHSAESVTGSGHVQPMVRQAPSFLFTTIEIDDMRAAWQKSPLPIWSVCTATPIGNAPVAIPGDLFGIGSSGEFPSLSCRQLEPLCFGITRESLRE